ncbi:MULTISPECIES: hypothetical protein [unclassified Streptomyces]|uniref:hypothetical protein n=1 Tax=unclassified Streptomyces TaxID=2593676 RepID=UPI00081F6091|nr:MULTISPECIES: hypothetical protein [unclassified Streptomyces]MYZ40135.1 hypothetical protein [Streptomyces sp. SID4917]SCG06712.1 hypothetical protein GA0115259_110517 [Streptomyces sp. MnatMP-M17]
MDHRTDQPTPQPSPAQQPEPDRTPRPSQILAQPATVATCTADYDSAADVRQTMDRQNTTRRH